MADRHRLWRITLIPAFFLLAQTAVLAEEVRWRFDRQAALREAEKTGKPLLYDFGTEACFWCKKLDATTFRVPGVARLLGERFIPVKIDADKDMRFTQSLGIQSYPTLILASPDGKILGRHEGYADANQMTRLLEQTLARLPSQPSPLNITPASLNVAGSPMPPASPTDSNAFRKARARELLTQAQRDRESRCYLGCLERCKIVMVEYADLPEAEEARGMARQLTEDAETYQRVLARLNYLLGEHHLQEGQNLHRQGRLAEALERLEQVCRLCPGSALGQSAAQLLEQVRGTAAKPAQPANPAPQP